MSGTGWSGWLTRARLLEIARYSAVGFGTFLLDTASLIALHGGAHLQLALATALAFAFASLVNFVLSRQWVFEQASAGATPRAALIRYTVLVLLGLGVTAALVPALAGTGVDYRIAKILVSLVVGVGNYFAFPRWVFRAATRPGALA
jgi:putative flippase GtrA